MINNEFIKEELPNKSALAINDKKENNTNVNSLDADLKKKTNHMLLQEKLIYYFLIYVKKIKHF